MMRPLEQEQGRPEHARFRLRGRLERSGLVDLVKFQTVPKLIPEQLQIMTSREALGIRPSGSFNPFETASKLAEQEGKEAFAIDIGGTELKWGRVKVINGKTEYISAVQTYKSKHGAGYLEKLLELREQTEGIPLGISFAGPITGTNIELGPNLSEFEQDLRAGNGTDLADLFKSFASKIVGRNDADASLVATATEAARTRPNLKKVIFLTCSTGIGQAVWVNGESNASEAAHTKVIDALNPTGITRTCPVNTDGSTCLENVASGSAAELEFDGISGSELDKQAASGDRKVRAFYRNSARIVSHIITALDSELLFQGEQSEHKLSPNQTAVVLDGGVVNGDNGYVDQVKRILKRASGHEPTVLTAKKDLGLNKSSLMGAAMAALI